MVSITQHLTVDRSGGALANGSREAAPVSDSQVKWDAVSSKWDAAFKVDAKLLRTSGKADESWTARFNPALDRLGVSSFEGLFRKEYSHYNADNNLDFRAAASSLSQDVLHHQHAVWYGERVVGHSLRRLDDTAVALTEMIGAAEKLRSGGPVERAELSRLLMSRGRDVFSNIHGAAEEYAAFARDLGYTSTGGFAAKSVMNADSIVNFIKDGNAPDVDANNYYETTRGAKGGSILQASDLAGGLAPADGDLSQAMFSVDAFAGGKFSLDAFGAVSNSFADVDDPAVIENLIGELKGALGKVRDGILSQGRNFREFVTAGDQLQEIRDIQDAAWERGEAGQVVADIQESLDRLSPLEKRRLISDYLANELDRQRRKSILDWLDEAQKSRDDNTPHQPYEQPPETERLLKAMDALAEAIRELENKQDAVSSRDDDRNDAASDDVDDASSKSAREPTEPGQEEVSTEADGMDKVLELIWRSRSEDPGGENPDSDEPPWSKVVDLILADENRDDEENQAA